VRSEGEEERPDVGVDGEGGGRAEEQLWWAEDGRFRLGEARVRTVKYGQRCGRAWCKSGREESKNGGPSWPGRRRQCSCSVRAEQEGLLRDEGKRKGINTES
jgi:hypothetical protein